MDAIFNILDTGFREAFDARTAGVAIAIIGLNIHFGFTGLLNFGQAGFMTLGAYGFAIGQFYFDQPLLLSVLMGLGAALIFAIVLGAPTLTLRGDYLAIVTISAAEILRFTFRLSNFKEVTGGALGINTGQYYPRVRDFSFLPDQRFTLIPFNYNEIGDNGSDVARLIGTIVMIGAFAAMAYVFVGMRKRGIDSGLLADLAVIPMGIGMGIVFAVLALMVSNSGLWTGVMLVAAVIAFLTAVVAIRRVASESPPREHVMGMAMASAFGLLAVFALFFSYPLNYDNNQAAGWWPRLLGWLLVLLGTLIVAILARSPWGRMLRGVREDEDAMRSLGKNVFAVKMQALIIGGLFGAVGGMVYILPITAQPDALGRNLLFFSFTALLIGGAATIFGPILGALIYFGSRLAVKASADEFIPGLNDQQTDQLAFVVAGLVLVLIVIFRPQGILGDKRELSINA